MRNNSDVFIIRRPAPGAPISENITRRRNWKRQRFSLLFLRRTLAKGFNNRNSSQRHEQPFGTSMSEPPCSGNFNWEAQQQMSRGSKLKPIFNIMFFAAFLRRASIAEIRNPNSRKKLGFLLCAALLRERIYSPLLGYYFLFFVICNSLGNYMKS